MEVAACANDTAPVAVAPSPGDPSPASGPLLPQLIGNWRGRAEVFTNYTFIADGSVTRTLQVSSMGGITGHVTYTDGPSERGTATESEGVLVLTWDTQTFTTGPSTERYRVDFVDFIDYKHTPQLTNLDCTSRQCTILLTTLR